MNANLLIKKQQDELLDTFVANLSNALGCSKWKQRQSSNYVEERYFRCFVLGLEITAAIADSSEFSDYDFWLCIEPEGGQSADGAFLDELADCIARKLAICGYEVVRPHDFGRSDRSGMLYRLSQTVDAKPREQVATEEI